MNKPLITAHTGCMHTPTNSIQSVREGIKAGAEIIEVDIRTTKDGVVVLLHDEEVKTSSGMQRIQNLTYEELNKSTPEQKITLLEEVIPLIKEKNRLINLDLKEDLAIDPMIRTIERYEIKDHVIITGCGKERAANVKENYRDYQVLLNTNASLYQTVEGDIPSFVQTTIHDAISASCCGININYKLCSDELLHQAKLRSLPVWVWTVDNFKDMVTFLNKDVHSITTNYVKTLYALRENLSH